MSDDESDEDGVGLSPAMRPGNIANLTPNALPSVGVDSGQPAITNGSGAVLQPHYPPSDGGGFSYSRLPLLEVDLLVLLKLLLLTTAILTSKSVVRSAPNLAPSHIPATNINPQDSA